MTDGSAFFQLQEEFRAAFENTIVDLPRNMLIAYPHLLHDVNVAVVVCELTLASARDAIRLLAWLKTNAPSCQTLVVANKVQAGGVEISRKDFESSIERKIDLVIPFDSKATAQAAKLGKPVVDSVRSSKVASGIVTLAEMIKSTGTPEPVEEEVKSASKKSMLGGFKSLLAKK